MLYIIYYILYRYYIDIIWYYMYCNIYRYYIICTICIKKIYLLLNVLCILRIIYILYTHILFELFVIIVPCPSFVSCFSLSGCLSLAISGMICSGCATQPMFVHHSIFIGFINVWPPRYWMVWVYQWICWRQNMQETRRFCHRLRQKPLHWTSLWWLSLANVWWLDPNVCWLDHIIYTFFLLKPACLLVSHPECPVIPAFSRCFSTVDYP
jgi:hypothetical protein